MNKFALTALAATMATAGTSFAEGTYQPTDYFSGAYVGAGVGAGVLLSDFKGSATDATTGLSLRDETRLGNTGFAGQVFAGYGQVFNEKFYLGGEISYLYQGAKPKTTDQSINGGAVDTVTISTSDKNNLGLAAHLGYLVNDKYLGYVIAGAQYGKQEAKLTFTDGSNAANNFTATDSKNKWAWVVGLGGLTPVCDNVLVGGEVQYAGFSKINAANNNQYSASSLSNGTWTMLARAAYRFDV